MPVDPPLTISAGSIVVDVDPAAGGRIAQVSVGGTDLLIGRGAVSDPMRWGSYPMVPWAGRIRDGRFRFDGEDHQLPLDDPPHAIHGLGYTSTWAVEERAATQLRLRLDLPRDGRWPFGGRVRQTVAVDAGGVSCTMSVSALDRPFPVSFGWHPWFRKPSSIDFRPIAMYRRDREHIAVDDLVDVPAGPWDDCFLNDEPVGLRVDDVAVTLTSGCRHWVVYDQPAHATCVEPQTGPPDAFTIRPEVVEPGRSRFAWFRIALARVGGST